MPRYAFATLGVPGVPLTTVLEMAGSAGYTGIEARCADGEPIHPDMPAEERKQAAAAFHRAGVTPVGLASYVKVAQPGPDQPVIAALRDHLRLAADLGFGAVRVFPGGGDSPSAAADARAVRRLRTVADQAGDLGVRVLLETHDSHRAAAAAAHVLARVGSPAIGALWDTMHTHLAGDSPSAAVDTLLPYLGYAQVKDMTADRTPVALGAGVLPAAESVRALLATGYDGWLVWEYEAKWHPEAEPLPPLLAAGRDWLRGAAQPHN
jgi:sugar phosphate isomerase/epimerase